MPQVQLILLSTTLIVAFCSMTYELILAQTLAAVLGDSIFQYAFTLSAFLAAMGLGAFLFNPKRFANAATLVGVELTLSALGAACPFVLILIQHSTQDLSDPIRPWVQLSLSHSLTVSIGYLSGMELPLLMQMAESDRPDSGADRKILTVDYLGMLFATLAFPFLLLPGFGLFSTAVITATLNLSVAWVIFCLLAKPRKRADWVAILATSACLVAALFYSTSSQSRFIQRFFMGI